MFKWPDREKAIGIKEFGAAPGGVVVATLQREVDTTRATILAKEEAINARLMSLPSQIPPQNQDNTDYDTVTSVHSDLVIKRDAVDKNQQVALSFRPGIDSRMDTGLSNIRSAGHDPAGTQAAATSKVSSIVAQSGMMERYNVALDKQIKGLQDFESSMRAEANRQKHIDEKAETAAKAQIYSPLTGPNIPVMRATLINPAELVHTRFFDDMSRDANIAAFDLALARVLDINAKNAHKISTLTYAAKHRFEYGIKKLLEKNALTADTMVCLFKWRLEDASRLFIKLVSSLHGYKEIFTSLTSESMLTHIDLSYAPLDLAGITSLVSALKQNQSVVYLDLSGNNIGEVGSEQIEDLLTFNAKIEHLKLSKILAKDSVGIDFISNITDALVDNNVIKSLDLSGSSIPYDTAIAIARMLKSNTTMKVLDISDNSVEDDGVCYIVSDLATNMRLLSINLAKNNITNKGAEAIAEWLSDNVSVVSLDLSDNKIGQAGAEFIKDAIDRNRSIIKFAGIEDVDGHIAQKIAENFALFQRKLASLDTPDDFLSYGDLFKELFVLAQQVSSVVDMVVHNEKSLFTKMQSICKSSNIDDSTDPYATELLAKFAEVLDG